MKKLYSIVITLLVITNLNLNAQTLLASYPLTADGVDMTGNNSEMSISEAPFQNGGIYSNGIYYGNDPAGSHIQSPQIADFDFDNLTVKVDFFLEEHPEFSMPIIMCGTSWRWMSAWMFEDKIALKVNNGSIQETSEVVVDLNQWHTVSVSYNKAEGKAMLYLNYELVLTLEVAELTHGENARVVNSDGGIGNTYKGYWRNLDIYNSSVVASVDNKIMESIDIKSLGGQVQINIPFDNNGIDLQMIDLSGRNIGEYKLSQGTNNIIVPQGNNVIMFVLTDQKGNQSVRKLGLNN